MSAKFRNSGRRAFLKGVGGATLSLPLLEYTHERVWAAGETFGKRLVNVVSHGGETMCVYKDGGRGGAPRPSYDAQMPKIDHWLPMAGWNFGEAHEVFRDTDLESKLMVIRGIDNTACTHGRYGGDHNLSNCTTMTARPTSGENDTEKATGPSVDWVVAQRLQKRYGGPSTPLNLIVPGHYYGTVFFWGANGEQRTAGESNPRTAFNALFQNVTSGEPDPAIVRRKALKSSMLNGLMDGYKRFSARLGKADQQIVDAHFDHLSELEREIGGLEVTAQCVVPGTPASFDWYTDQQEKLAPLHAELIVAALRCGLTNVANLEIADILTPWMPSGLQIESAYNIGHSLDHHVSDIIELNKVAQWELEMKENRAWRMGLVKQIADGLNDPNFMEGDRTMLDNSLVFYSNEFSTGGIHSSTDGAYLFLGDAGGYFKTGRFVELHSKRKADPNYMGAGGSTASINDLFISILNALGEPDTTFGDMALSMRKGAITELRG
ncbi:MAG: DUF1552 domain-containing protein [Myxococcales bacterium]|nr:DUF1552 domain-containing protein [Myxococcales bacterium]